PLLAEMKMFMSGLLRGWNKKLRRVKRDVGIESIQSTVRLYEEYIDYREWLVMSHSRNLHSPLANSISGTVAQKVTSRLEELIEQTGDRNQHLHLDIGVLMLLRLFEFDNQLERSLSLLHRYCAYRPDHLHAHLYLYQLLARY